MRAPRDIIKHVCVETAKARRKCHRDKAHRIAMGEKCVVIRDGSFGASKNYCVPCAREILDAASERIGALRNHLEES
jgi:hypothetical protein